ncbi:MAG: Protein of unassigned function [Hyphomicrobiales bacterium]|nr:Protein of unassigned function [Hyphomicrobiales bacterium]
MSSLSRRTLVMHLLPGATVAGAGLLAAGWTLKPDLAEATPLSMGMGTESQFNLDSLVEDAQAVVVSRPHRRARRRRVCWWRRGRRVCTWR